MKNFVLNFQDLALKIADLINCTLQNNLQILYRL